MSAEGKPQEEGESRAQQHLGVTTTQQPQGPQARLTSQQGSSSRQELGECQYWRKRCSALVMLGKHPSGNGFCSTASRGGRVKDLPLTKAGAFFSDAEELQSLKTHNEK